MNHDKTIVLAARALRQTPPPEGGEDFNAYALRLRRLPIIHGSPIWCVHEVVIAAARAIENGAVVEADPESATNATNKVRRPTDRMPNRRSRAAYNESQKLIMRKQRAKKAANAAKSVIQNNEGKSI
jgi:hypothetical protein